MRILYVAKHGSGDNDDEGAIAYALEKLGHTVLRVHEDPDLRSESELRHVEADFCLFHKWEEYETINTLAARMPLAFWYFDLVANSDDPTLVRRMEARRRWMERIIPVIRVGFCTDGDWVDLYNRSKGRDRLVWLTQGMDERVAGFGRAKEIWPQILFTGMIHHGQKRAEHIHELRSRYGPRFLVIGNGGPLRRRHGRDLADLFDAVKIVIAPDGPQTDRYWSNRVYLTLGLGGFLLHPYCEGLAAQYVPTQDLLMYHDRDELYFQIDHYLNRPEERQVMRERGFWKTMRYHTYRHRCEKLIEEMRRRI